MKRARPRVCRSKYLGATVRVRGREATVVGCARPKQRPAPKAPVARFRVIYAKSGRTRPVPRKTVYRAARCGTKPDARGCAPLDPERAPWLARRPLDASFDFGAIDPQPAAPSPRRRAARTPELQAPVRLPSPPLLAVMQPETRELARWLAYAAPWAWRAVAEEVAKAHQVDPATGAPLTREQKLVRYGTNYGRGYGAIPEPNAPERRLIGSGDSIATPGFVVRPSARSFVADAQKVAGAILALESAVWSGAMRRSDEGNLYPLLGMATHRLVIAPGTHPSTAAAMRRRAAEADDRVRHHLSVLDGKMAEARAIVAGWASGTKPIPDGIKALDRAGHGLRRDQDDVEYAETWSHRGEDWRMTITHESGDVRVERWTRAGWRFAWGTKFDTRRDTIPMEDSPADVADALRALLASGGVNYHLPRLFGGGLAGRRREALARYDRGAADPDPFSLDCVPPASVREAWQFTRRIPCATPKAREALVAARDRELAALCEDPLSEGCDAFHDLVASGCGPACDPAKGGRDEGDCPAQITAAQIERWSTGMDPVPDHIFDSDKPHLIGQSDNCYYSDAMRARRALHARVVDETPIPAAVAQRGPSAVQAFLREAIERAEAADPRGAAWQRNDQRILGRVKPAAKSGGDPLDELKRAFAAHVRGDDGPAYSLAKRGYVVTDASGEVDESSLIDALLEAWTEAQHSTSQKGREARFAAFRRRLAAEGRYAVAASIAGVTTTGARTRQRTVVRANGRRSGRR